MKPGLLAACVVLALGAGLVHADPVGDATAGLDALNRGDDATAIRLFTRALDSGVLSASDRELGYVKRAEANLAIGRNSAALRDAQRALVLSPRDDEAAAVRDKARGGDGGPSLADTMSFIQRALTSWGAVRFQISVHDSDDNSDNSSVYFQPPADASIGPDECSLTLQIAGQDNTISLRAAGATQVLDAASELTRFQHDSGHGNIAVTETSPDAFATATEFGSGRYDRYFLDQDSAENFAKAMTHAAELCAKGAG